MAVNTKYLIERFLYEKLVRGRNSPNRKDHFIKTYPDILTASYIITPEIEEADRRRRETVKDLKAMEQQGSDEDDFDFDPIYQDLIDGCWYFFREEIKAFYEANTSRLDAVLTKYKEFVESMYENENN
jgi:hypothetical protein